MAARPALTAAVSDAARATQREILTFWFGSDLTNPENNFELWFAGTRDIDAVITDKFKPDVEAAARGEYMNWMGDAHGALALILLLDQFSLNIYRDLSTGYHVSSQAIPLSYTMIGRGFTTTMPPSMKMFSFLPLEHSECLVDQDKNVALHTEAGLELEDAMTHRDIIAKYGRFPGRNRVFGRTNTAEEEQYLKDGGVF